MNAVLKLMQAKGLTKKAAEKLLPKAERDENLKKFLEPSLVKDRMFHGSSTPDIVEFKTGLALQKQRYPQIEMKPWEHTVNRDAVFLTPDPQFASRYSGEDWYVGPGSAPTTYPVRVQAQNPWDYDNPEHIEPLRGKGRVWILFSHANQIEIELFLSALDKMGTKQGAWLQPGASLHLYDLK